MSAARTIGIVVATSLASGAIGYALAPREPGPAAIDPRDERGALEDGLEDRLEDRLEDEALAPGPSALEACEVRLIEAEEALARRPAALAAPFDPSELPEETRAAMRSPEVSRAIDAEVERRIEARFERERARRREEWAQRRAEHRERLRAIGIDDRTLAEVTPAVCAIRDAFRQAWREGRGEGGGDGGVRDGRRAVREATRPLRDEVAATLGEERMARLEDEGGMRALGSAIACEGDERPRGGP